MNILPLVLALVLMLTLLTVEKMEKFKNQTIVEREYQHFLQTNERKVFNQREKNLFGDNEKSLRQLSFRYFIDKKAREANPSAASQYRIITLEFMRIVYGNAAFFKNLEKKRGPFLEEMLNAIELATTDMPDKTIKKIEDIARLNLKDPELQEAFYHMLKGTILRDDLMKLENPSPEMKEKAYVSLFAFINYDGKANIPKITLQRAPKELLIAIFGSQEVADEVIFKRNELSKKKESGSEQAFKDAFLSKVRPGINPDLLNFSISDGDKTEYN